MRSGQPGAGTGRRLAVTALLIAGLTATSCSSGAPARSDTTGRPARPLPSTTEGGPPSLASQPPGSTPLGAKWDWGRYNAFLPYLQRLSGGHTYYEVVWCDIEPSQGQRDWSALDRLARRSQALGISLSLKLRVGSCWNTGGGAQYTRGSKNKTESEMPKDLGAYRSWVEATVARYAALGVKEFAVENEVNSKSFWGGTPQQYTQLVDIASQAIRAADRDATVVDGGLSSTTYGYGIADDLLRAGRDSDAVKAWNTYYAQRIGTRGDQLPAVHDRAGLEAVLQSDQGRRNLEYLSVVTKLAEQKTVAVRQVHFYEAWDAVDLLLTYLRAHTPAGTPVEAWEVGSFDKSSAQDDAVRAEDVLRTTSLMLAGGVRVVIWLPLAFDPGGRNSGEPRYGLLNPDGTVRTAGRLFQAMVDASRGAKPVPVAGGGLRGVSFERDGGAKAFVWAPTQTRVTLGAGDSAGPVGGGSASSAPGQVVVGSSPVELSLRGSTADFLGRQK